VEEREEQQHWWSQVECKETNSTPNHICFQKRLHRQTLVHFSSSIPLVLPTLKTLHQVKVTSSAMSELIVDFPKLECQSDSSGKMVRFSPTSELVCYEAHCNSDDIKLFYNKLDYQAMMIENCQVVIDLQKMFLPLVSKSRSSNPADHFNPDDVFGNEKLLAPKLVSKVARQDESGEQYPGAIARVSHQYSKEGVR